MSHDEDRSLDASAGAVWRDVVWDELVIPDDCRDLASDIETYRREQRAARRHVRWSRSRWHRGWNRIADHPVGIPALVVAACLCVAGLAAGLLTAVGPRGLTDVPVRSTLATPQAPAGTVGGLLPAVTLYSPTGSPEPAQYLAPGLVAALPLHCDCTSALQNLANAAAAQHATFDIVVPAGPGRDAEADALLGQFDSEVVTLHYDPAAALAEGLGAVGLTTAVVDPQGRITEIDKSVTRNDPRPVSALTKMRSNAEQPTLSG